MNDREQKTMNNEMFAAGIRSLLFDSCSLSQSEAIL